VNPDQLAAHEEERRFLLRSLDDLEREHAAGDVDDHDYQELRESYTVRAAATLRAIDESRSAIPVRPPVDWRRRVGGAGVVIVLIGVVWWALVASSAERLPGQQVTGLDPRGEQAALLAQARTLQVQQPGAAAALYEVVLADDPAHVEALTYRGWALSLDASNQATSEAETQMLMEGIESLFRATELDPGYPDPHCFLGIVLFTRLGLADDALPRIDTCLAAGPPADVRGLVEGLRDRVVAATAAAGE
jgi:hypothetical protein